MPVPVVLEALLIVSRWSQRTLSLQTWQHNRQAIIVVEGEILAFAALQFQGAVPRSTECKKWDRPCNPEGPRSGVEPLHRAAVKSSNARSECMLMLWRPRVAEFIEQGERLASAIENHFYAAVLYKPHLVSRSGPVRRIFMNIRLPTVGSTDLLRQHEVRRTTSDLDWTCKAKAEEPGPKSGFCLCATTAGTKYLLQGRLEVKDAKADLDITIQPN